MHLEVFVTSNFRPGYLDAGEDLSSVVTSLNFICYLKASETIEGKHVLCIFFGPCKAVALREAENWKLNQRPKVIFLLLHERR